MPDGNNAPAVVTGDMASAVIAFKIPESGKYSFDFSAVAGAKDDTVADADGLTVSVYAAGTKVYSKATSVNKLDNLETEFSGEYSKGDMIYFIADPNANGGNDSAIFSIYAKLTEKAAAEDTNDNNNNEQDTGDQTTSGNDTEIPPTGEKTAAPFVLLACAASFALLVLLKIKKPAVK